MRQRRRG